MDLDFATLRNFAIALLIGAMVGVEREKRRLSEGSSGVGGLRTFIVMAQVGALAAWLGREIGTPWLFPAAILAAAGTLIAAYVANVRASPDTVGMTTEIAALEVCLLGGACTLGYPELAVVLGVVTAAVLAYKQPLHGLVEKLGWDDIFAGLRLLIATFIVLPLLPNRTLDPWQSINPYALWLLVILISGLSLVGYVATRWLGPGRGAAVTGVTGGLVSSTAVTLSFARRSRDFRGSHSVSALACGVLLAWTVMCARILVEIAVVHPRLLAVAWPPFVAMGGVGLVAAWLFFRGSGPPTRGDGVADDVPLRNPFSLREACRFALLFAAVLLAVHLVERYAPAGGVYVVALLAGITDVDAITLSLADKARQGGDPAVAVQAIFLAAAANTAVKAGLVAALGSVALRTRVAAATMVMLAAGAAALWLFVG